MNISATKQKVARGAAASAAVGLALVNGGGVASAMAGDSSSSMDQVHYYQADLGSLNGSGARGYAYVMANGNQAHVMIKTTGLSANLPHAQHIHMGGKGMCPTLANDTNHDGLVSVAEGQPSYGMIKSSLTTEGDTSAASALAVSRFPMGGADGTTNYDRTITLPDGVMASDLGQAEIVQHGISNLFGDPAKYDGSKPSSIDPSLPLEATIPADCGELHEVSAAMMPSMMGGMSGMMMTDGQQSADAFHTAVIGALNKLASSTNNDPAATQFYQAYMTADSNFMAQMKPGMSTDAMNHAKADYFNALDAAKNQLADSLNRDGHATAKDSFMNSFNSARDSYSNQFEAMKQAM